MSGTCFPAFGFCVGVVGLPTGPRACMDTDQSVPLLRVNDWLLRINDVDLINKDKKQAIKALLNGEGAINMVVRRRKSLGGKVVTPLHINLSGQKGRGQQKRAEGLRWQGVPLLFRGMSVSGCTSFPGMRPWCCLNAAHVLP